MLGRQLVGLQHQSLDAPTILEVGFQDLVDVRLRFKAVPDALGIDHHVRPELAAIETAGGVEANLLNAELARLLARIAAQFLKAAGGFCARHAAATRMTLGSHIVAHENMAVIKELRIVGHSSLRVA